MRETLSADVVTIGAGSAGTFRPEEWRGRRVVVAGDGDAASASALALLPFAAEVTLIRAEVDLVAASLTERAVRAAAASLQIRLVTGDVASLDVDRGRLRAVRVRSPGGSVPVGADVLLLAELDEKGDVARRAWPPGSPCPAEGHRPLATATLGEAR